MQDRAAQQRVAEVDPAPRALECPRAAGRREEHPVEVGGGESGAGPRPQQQGRVGARPVRLVLLRRRGQQEQGVGVTGQPVQVGGVGVEDALAAGQRVRQRGPSRQLAGGEPPREPGQQTWVPGRFPQEFAAHDGVDVGGAVGEPVQERGRRVVVQRAEAQGGQPGEGRLVGRADHHRDAAARAQSAGGEAERGPGVGVPEVGVVHADQQGLFGAQGAQEPEQGAGGDAGAQDRVGCEGQRAGGGAEQGVESAVGKSLFGGGGGGVQHGAAVSPEVVGGGLPQQGGTAEAGRRGQHEGSAVPCPQLSQQGFQDGQFTASSVQPERTVHGRRWGHTRTLLPRKQRRKARVRLRFPAGAERCGLPTERRTRCAGAQSGTVRLRAPVTSVHD